MAIDNIDNTATTTNVNAIGTGDTTTNVTDVITNVGDAGVTVPKPVTKTDVLKELSKELGINVFEAEGLQKVKKLIDSQKTEQEKLQGKYDLLFKEKEGWTTKELQYQSKLKASELGIHADNLEDALKLAGGDPDKLPDVLKKYPVFKSKEGVTIGLTNPNNHKQPSGHRQVHCRVCRRECGPRQRSEDSGFSLHRRRMGGKEGRS